jgi:outer membrane protein assembly factor BamD (BamD/ComL family)
MWSANSSRTLRLIAAAAFVPVLITACSTPAHALGERATPVREAVIYLSPDDHSPKLGIADRGRELIILETTPNWLHVEAMLGVAPVQNGQDEDEAVEKTITGWIKEKGVVRVSTPNGDQIVYGEATDSEDQASRRGGRRGAAQDASRLYYRVYDLFPTSPLAPAALYRAADIRWQIEKSDVNSRPSAHAKEAFLRVGMDEQWMKLVIKKYPGTKWADLASFQLIENKLCGDWQGDWKCPDKEAEIYEKYAAEHPQSPTTAEALYDAAWRRAALIEIYKGDGNAKKSDESRAKAIVLVQKIASQYPQSDYAARAQRLMYLLQQGVPTYGNATD